MNPLTNMKNVLKLSEHELKRVSKSSWHDMYSGSAWIFVGGFPFTLSEGDIICVFSQYGEIVNINLIRDKSSGKSKGFCFICYEDQRSTILAVDNLNGIKVLISISYMNNPQIKFNLLAPGFLFYLKNNRGINLDETGIKRKILGRTLRVDHVSDYKPPKEHEKHDEETLRLYMEGCAPKPKTPIENVKTENINLEFNKTHPAKKSKKEDKLKKVKHRGIKKKASKKKKHKKKGESGSSSSNNSETDSN